MTAELLDTYEPGSDAWHAQRRTALGGSEVAAVLGISPFESPFALWHRKAGLLAPTPDRPEMEWGRRLESAVRQKWVDEHAATHTRPRLGRTFLADGWRLASPDGLPRLRRGSRRVEPLEIKTAHNDADWGEPGTDQVPVYYLTQVRWYLGILDAEVAHLAVLIGGGDYREYVIRQNADDLELMVSAGRAFLDSLAAGERPDIDSSDITYQAVRELHPEIDRGTRVTLGAEMAAELLASRRALDAAAERHTLAKSVVLDAMGDGHHGVDEFDVRVAYRTARAKKDGSPGTPYLQVDRKAVAAT